MEVFNRDVVLYSEQAAGSSTDVSLKLIYDIVDKFSVSQAWAGDPERTSDFSDHQKSVGWLFRAELHSANLIDST